MEVNPSAHLPLGRTMPHATEALPRHSGYKNYADVARHSTLMRRRAGAGLSEATNVAMPLAAKISNTFRERRGGREGRLGKLTCLRLQLHNLSAFIFGHSLWQSVSPGCHIARLPYSCIATCHLPLASMQQIIGII